jgi:hypothetical protein
MQKTNTSLKFNQKDSSNTLIDRLDAFAASPPPLNVAGTKKVGTYIGFGCTMVCAVVMVLFSVE